MKVPGGGLIEGLCGGYALATGPLSVPRAPGSPPSSVQNALKSTAGAVGWCLDKGAASYVGGGAGPVSTISVHVPERLRARRCLGLSTT